MYHGSVRIDNLIKSSNKISLVLFGWFNRCHLIHDKRDNSSRSQSQSSSSISLSSLSSYASSSSSSSSSSSFASSPSSSSSSSSFSSKCKLSENETIIYVSPEIMYPKEDDSWLISSSRSIESDIYSFGILFWQIFKNKFQPYPQFDEKKHDSDKRRALIFLGERPLLVDDDWSIPGIAKDIMRGCWDQLIEKRPDFNRICVRLKTLNDDIRLTLSPFLFS